MAPLFGINASARRRTACFKKEERNSERKKEGDLPFWGKKSKGAERGERKVLSREFSRQRKSPVLLAQKARPPARRKGQRRIRKKTGRRSPFSGLVLARIDRAWARRKDLTPLIPNIMPQQIVARALGSGCVVLTESTLSDLNLGVLLTNSRETAGGDPFAEGRGIGAIASIFQTAF